MRPPGPSPGARGRSLRPYLVLFLVSFPLWYAGLVLRGGQGLLDHSPVDQHTRQAAAWLGGQAALERAPDYPGDRRLRRPALRQLPARPQSRRAAPRPRLRQQDAERPLRDLLVLAARPRGAVRPLAPPGLGRTLRLAREPRLRLRHEPVRHLRAGQRLGVRAEPGLLPGRPGPAVRPREPGGTKRPRLLAARPGRGLPAPSSPALPALPDPRRADQRSVRWRGRRGRSFSGLRPWPWPSPATTWPASGAPWSSATTISSGRGGCPRASGACPTFPGTRTTPSCGCRSGAANGLPSASTPRARPCG